MEVKKYAKRGTYAGLWPEISASATYNRYIKKQTMHIMDQTMTVGTSNIYQGGFSATMPVVNAQLWKSLKISAMDVELAVEQARGSRIDMIEQVSKAFYQVLLAKDSYTVYKRVYDNAVENHKIVTKKYEVGSVSEYEFLRSKVTVSNAEPDVLNAENSIVVALVAAEGAAGHGSRHRYRLRRIAGRLRVDDDLALRHGVQPPSATGEMKQLEIQERQLQKTLEMQRAANLPTLDISASYNFTAMEDTFKFNQYTWNPYSYATLSLNIPIFAGGKHAALDCAKLNLSNMQLQRENTERTLRTSIMQYASNMQTNLKQYNSSLSSVAEAKRGYDIAVKRYEVGDGTLVEIDDSQLAYTQAELTRSTAIYDYLVNQVSLEKIRGTYMMDDEASTADAE